MMGIEEGQLHHSPRPSAPGSGGNGNGAAVPVAVDESAPLLLNANSRSSPHSGAARAASPLAVDSDSNVIKGGSSRRNKKNRKRCISSRSTVALMTVFSACVILLYGAVSIVPTSDELELAQQYDISNPFFGGIARLRAAQQLADAQRLTLSRMAGGYGDPDIRKTYREVTKGGPDGEAANRKYSDPPEGCEATVVLVRHCEKGAIREHCAHIGYERSVYLSTLFGDSDTSRWPAPSYIFAEGPGHRNNPKKMNFREVETVGPLSKKIGVEVDDR